MKIGKFVIEEKIVPLVKSLNNTGLVRTVSSCQGHPGEYYIRPDQPDVAKPDFAHVLFEPAEGFTSAALEKFVNYCLSNFVETHGFDPINFSAHKNYIPVSNRKKPDWLLEFKLEPHTKFHSSERKRHDLDMAINQLAEIVDAWCVDQWMNSPELPF